MNHYTVHTDGGARGNPGPAGIGFILEGPGISRVEHGEYIGETTNNVAEYRAAISALKKLKSLIGSDAASKARVQIYTDSELLVKQVNGEYKVKEEGIQGLFLELWNARLDFDEVTVVHVFREQNKDADRMVNFVIDREQHKLL